MQPQKTDTQSDLAKDERAAIFPRTAGLTVLVILIVASSIKLGLESLFTNSNFDSIRTIEYQILFVASAIGVVSVLLGLLFDKRGYSRKPYFVLGAINALALIGAVAELLIR